LLGLRVALEGLKPTDQREVLRSGGVELHGLAYGGKGLGERHPVASGLGQRERPTHLKRLFRQLIKVRGS
jgi:hypothetical protein